MIFNLVCIQPRYIIVIKSTNYDKIHWWPIWTISHAPIITILFWKLKYRIKWPNRGTNLISTSKDGELHEIELDISSVLWLTEERPKSLSARKCKSISSSCTIYEHKNQHIDKRIIPLMLIIRSLNKEDGPDFYSLCIVFWIMQITNAIFYKLYLLITFHVINMTYCEIILLVKLLSIIFLVLIFVKLL